MMITRSQLPHLCPSDAHGAAGWSASPDLATLLSHDLQEPLRRVVSFLQLLDRRAGSKLDAEDLAWLNAAAIEARGLKRQLQDLSALAEVEQGAEDLALVDLRQVLHDALVRVEPARRNAQAVIALGRPAPPAWLRPRQITLLLEHLVDNAIRYGQRRVTVGTRRHHGALVIRISDNGPGLPPDMRKDAMRPFRKYSKLSSGSGIGLPISEAVAARHGGRIVWRTRPAGNSILVVLPRAYFIESGAPERDATA